MKEVDLMRGPTNRYGDMVASHASALRSAKSTSFDLVLDHLGIDRGE